MNYFYLAVWSGESGISNKDAAKYYAALSTGNIPQTFSEAVYAFCSDITRRYPDPNMVADEEMDPCPWACALEVSGCHVIMALLPDRYAEAFPLILQLANQYGLICFDPQNTKVHLPSSLLHC